MATVLLRLFKYAAGTWSRLVHIQILYVYRRIAAAQAILPRSHKLFWISISYVFVGFLAAVVILREQVEQVILFSSYVGLTGNLL